MEELPAKAKTVMEIYAAATLVGESTAVYFGANRREITILFWVFVVVSSVTSYFYIKKYFRHYKYYISDSMIIIKKGTAVKRRYLIYTHEISDITITENFVQRWFGLCTIWFHMSGHSVKLSYVLVEKSEQLQKILDSRY